MIYLGSQSFTFGILEQFFDVARDDSRIACSQCRVKGFIKVLVIDSPHSRADVGFELVLFGIVLRNPAIVLSMDSGYTRSVKKFKPRATVSRPEA